MLAPGCSTRSIKPNRRRLGCLGPTLLASLDVRSRVALGLEGNTRALRVALDHKVVAEGMPVVTPRAPAVNRNPEAIVSRRREGPSRCGLVVIITSPPTVSIGVTTTTR